MQKQFITACLYTLVTTVLLGLGYPLAVTGLAHLLMPAKANGDLITKDGVLIGSKLIGQSFTGAGYFNSRPSAAGTGYDAANSSGSNLGPTNATLIARVEQSVQSWKSREAKFGNGQQRCPRRPGHHLRLRIGSGHYRRRCRIPGSLRRPNSWTPSGSGGTSGAGSH